METSLYMIALWLWLMAAAGQVQVGNYGVSYVSSAPTGACSPNAPLTIVRPSGAMYTCQNGTWGAVGGGPGAAVTSVSNSDSTLVVLPTTGDVVAALNLGHANNWTANNHVFSGAGAASTPAVSFTGTPFAGTGTTSIPLLYFTNGGAPPSATWNTNATYMGIEAPVGWAGNFADFQRNGSSFFSVNSVGAVTAGSLYSGSSFRTVAASGGYFELNAGGAPAWLTSPSTGVVNIGTTNGASNGTVNVATVQTAALMQQAANAFGGTCTMASGTTCTITIGKSYTVPVCIATVQNGTVITGGCTVSGAVATITAATTNSSTWGAVVFGNPN